MPGQGAADQQQQRDRQGSREAGQARQPLADLVQAVQQVVEQEGQERQPVAGSADARHQQEGQRQRQPAFQGAPAATEQHQPAVADDRQQEQGQHDREVMLARPLQRHQGQQEMRRIAQLMPIQALGPLRGRTQQASEHPGATAEPGGDPVERLAGEDMRGVALPGQDGDEGMVEI